jgi:hypothetical protein
MEFEPLSSKDRKKPKMFFLLSYQTPDSPADTVGSFVIQF